MLTKEFSVLEWLKNIKHQLEMSKRRKEIKITFDIKGDLKHYNIKASKEPFEQIIYMILFRILKMWDFEDDVNLTVFNCAENFAEVPQFEKVWQRLHDQLSRNVQDYIYIWIKSPWINGPRSSKLLTLINDCSDIVKRIDGMLVYEKQEIEEDYNIYIHQHPNLLHNPRIICLALPFKLGNW